MINDVTFFVSKREEFNEKIKIFSSMQNIPYFSYNKEIEKNLKFMTKAGHYVQSEGERIIAERLYECGIDICIVSCSSYCFSPL